MPGDDRIEGSLALHVVHDESSSAIGIGWVSAINGCLYCAAAGSDSSSKVS